MTWQCPACKKSESHLIYNQMGRIRVCNGCGFRTPEEEYHDTALPSYAREEAEALSYVERNRLAYPETEKEALQFEYETDQ